MLLFKKRYENYHRRSFFFARVVVRDRDNTANSSADREFIERLDLRGKEKATEMRKNQWEFLDSLYVQCINVRQHASSSG